MIIQAGILDIGIALPVALLSFIGAGQESMLLT